MKLLKTATMIGCAALVGAIVTPAVKADDFNKRTVVTFSGPVEIPGVHQKGWGVLPAGTYVFKLLDSQSDRHIVQIFSQDEKLCIATILAIPDYRLRPTDKTVITFSERPAGEPEALRTWFYPGSTYGDEFVYPKARAMEIAKVSNVPVLFAAVDLPVETVTPITVDAPVIVEMRRAPVMAIQPTGEQVQVATVVTPPPAPAAVQVAATPMPVADTLPATASMMPLIGLMGLMALAGAFALRAIPKRLQ